jgi:hypothetical protein
MLLACFNTHYLVNLEVGAKLLNSQERSTASENQSLVRQQHRLTGQKDTARVGAKLLDYD